MVVLKSFDPFATFTIDHNKEVNKNHDDINTAFINNLYSNIEDLRSELKQKNALIDRLLSLHERHIVEIYDKRISEDFSGSNCSSHESIVSPLIDFTGTSSSPFKSSVNGSAVMIHSNELDRDFDRNSFANVPLRKKTKMPPLTTSENARVSSKDDIEIENGTQTQYRSEVVSIADELESFPPFNVDQLEEKPDITPRSDNNENRGVMVPPPRIKKIKPWKPNTTLIIGDSVLSGIQENRLSKDGSIKIRALPGAVTRDLYDHLEAFMERKPSRLIIHIGTNEACDKEADEILLQLKAYITQRFKIAATISCPTLRIDSFKARNCIRVLRERLCRLNIPLIVHDNVTEECLGMEGKHLGFHVNPKGAGRLAINFQSFIRKH